LLTGTKLESTVNAKQTSTQSVKIAHAVIGIANLVIKYFFVDHRPVTWLKEWAMGCDSALIFSVLKIPIAHHHDTTMWANLAALNCL